MTDPFLVGATGNEQWSRSQARRREFALTSRGVRLATAAVDIDRARWLAAQLPLRPESVLSHPTAAQILQLPLPRALSLALPAHVTTPRQIPRPRRRDIVTHHAWLPPEHTLEIDGFRITTAERTYVDMASMLGFAQLVALGDRGRGLARRGGGVSAGIPAARSAPPRRTATPGGQRGDH